MDQQKAKKKKGPIRIEAIVPFFITLGLIYIYFFLFFDFHLRKGMEWVATELNGAEVNIHSLDTSFLGASLHVGKIEVTDASKPERNRFEIGSIQVKLLWDALLRAKLVTDQFLVLNIGVLTKRQKPGRVIPPEENSIIGETKNSLIEKYREKIAGTNLANLANFVKNFDPKEKLKNIGDLKALEHIKKLDQELSVQEKAWKNTLEGIKVEADISSLRRELDEIKPGGNPAEIQGKISKVKGLIGKADSKVNRVQEKSQQLTSSIDQFEKEVAKVDQTLAEDRKNIESELQIPKLDTNSVSEDIFGKVVSEKVGRYQGYTQLAKKYVPPSSPKKAKEEGVKPKPRLSGRDYQFGRVNSYPEFWLRKGKISSKAGESGLGGDVEGQILDLSSDQLVTGKPARFQLKGDFPTHEVRGVEMDLDLDQRNKESKIGIDIRVNSFPVGEQMFSDSESLKFGVKNSKATSRVVGEVKGDQLDFRIFNSFMNPSYVIQASSSMVQSVLTSVTSRLSSLAFNARVWGSSKDLNISFSVSNLGSALSDAFRDQLKGKFAAVKKQMNQMIDQKIGSKKSALTNRLSGVKGGVLSQVDQSKKKVSEARRLVDQKLSEVQRSVGGGGAKKVLKKFGF